MFNLIGTTYGGDGESTFALPDLRSRIPIHQGNGFVIAETGGTEEVTLTVNQIPAHSHNLGWKVAYSICTNRQRNAYHADREDLRWWFNQSLLQLDDF